MLEAFTLKIPTTERRTLAYLQYVKNRINKTQSKKSSKNMQVYAPKLPLIKVFKKYMTNRSTLIPFISDMDLDKALKKCSSVILDNSAFTFWRKGVDVDDNFWDTYYDWVREIYSSEKLDWFIIPDVIMGSETENNRLIDKFLATQKDIVSKGVPVWHTNESHERLKMLCDKFDRVCIGSADEEIYGKVGSDKWFTNLESAFSKVNFQNQKIHLLRFMRRSNVKKLKRFRKYDITFSGDSTNFAQNHHRYTKIGKEPEVLLLD